LGRCLEDERSDHRGIDYQALAAAATLIVDTRNAIKGQYPHVFRLGAPQPLHAADPPETATGSDAVTQGEPLGWCIPEPV
jgi:hypothetical protein